MPQARTTGFSLSKLGTNTGEAKLRNQSMNPHSAPFYPTSPTKVSDELKRVTQRMNKAANSGDVALCEQMFVQLLYSDVSPSSVTLNVLLKAFCSKINSKFYRDKAYNLLEEMKSKKYGCEVDEGTYNILISSLSKARQFDRALSLLTEQKERKLRTNKSLSSFMKFMPSHIIQAVVFSLLETDGSKEQTSIPKFTQNTLVDFNLLSYDIDTVVINTLLTSLNSSDAEMLVQYAENDLNLTTDKKTYSILLSKTTNIAHAQRLFAEFESKGFKPDLILLTSLLNCYVSAEPPSITLAEDLLEEMVSKHNLHLDLRVYNLLIKGYTRTIPPDYVKASQTLSTLLAKSKSQMRRSSKNTYTPTVVTISSVVNAYCSAGLAREAEEIARSSLTQLRLSPNSTLYNTLIKGYARCRCQVREGKCGCLQCVCCDPLEGLRLVKEMETLELSIDGVTVNTLVDALCSAKMFHRAKGMIDEVIDARLVVGIEVYDVFLKGLWRYCSRRREYGIEGEEETQDEEVIKQLILQVEADLTRHGIRKEQSTETVLIKLKDMLYKSTSQ